VCLFSPAATTTPAFSYPGSQFCLSAAVDNNDIKAGGCRASFFSFLGGGESVVGVGWGALTDTRTTRRRVVVEAKKLDAFHTPHSRAKQQRE
jgi:hypothetical protein